MHETTKNHSPESSADTGQLRIPKSRTRRKAAGLVLAFGLLAAACGSDDPASVEAEVVDSVPAAVQTDDDAMAEDDGAMEEDSMEEDGAMEEDSMEEDGAMEEDSMEEDGAMEEDSMEEMDDALGEVQLSFAGLEPLANGVHYEGWIIVDGAPVSTGNFNIDTDGGLVDLDGNTIDTPFYAAHTEDAEAVVISIEPANDTDPAPAAAKILGGAVVDGQAELTTAFPAALGTDFADASGVYILGTPTTDVLDDEFSGVWFIGLEGGAVQGLDLPTLPEGWEYEGWAVIDGVPISTGRFVNAASADDFNGFSGTDATGPNFPGEDFIVNAPDGVSFPTDLRDSTVVISVEPADDDSPAPFVLKPLVSEVADGIGDHEVQTFGTGPAAPTGTATLG